MIFIYGNNNNIITVNAEKALLRSSYSDGYYLARLTAVSAPHSSDLG